MGEKVIFKVLISPLVLFKLLQLHSSFLCNVQRKGQKPADFQVQKQDPDELNNVCKVMEDLIKMQISIFTVSTRQHVSLLIL